MNATISTSLENQALLDKLKADKEREKNTFKSLEEHDLKLGMSKIPSDVIISRSEKIVTSLAICHKERPDISYCLKLNEYLQFEMWCKGELVTKKYVSDPEIASSPQHLN